MADEFKLFDISTYWEPHNSNTKIGKFRDRHGYKQGFYCKNCKHLINSRFYKCRILGITNGKATDIRLKHTACNLYVEREVL